MAGNSLAFHYQTPERDYRAGWLATDGCVYFDPKRIDYQISLKLHSQDKAFLESFAIFLGTKPPRDTKSKKHSSHVITVWNRIMAKKLIELGITERKSHTLQVHSDLARSPYFWRGAFEGDGHIRENSKGHLEVSIFSVSKAFLEQFQSFYPHCSIDPTKKGWNAVSYCSNARRLLYLLYDGTFPDLVLPRKQPLVLKWGKRYQGDIL